MVGGASRGLGYAVARGAGRRGRAGVDLVAQRARRSTRPRSGSRRDGATVLGDGRGRPKRRIASPRWAARTIEKFGGVDLLFANAGGPPAGADALVRRRGVAGRVRPAALERGAHGARGRAVDEVARRRRDPGVDLVVGEGADPEPRAVERAARVGVGAVEDAGARAGRRQDPRQPDHAGPDRHRSRPQLDEIRGKKQGITADEARTKSVAAIPLGRYGERRRIRPRRRVPLLRRGVVHDRRDRQVDGGHRGAGASVL